MTSSRRVLALVVLVVLVIAVLAENPHRSFPLVVAKQSLVNQTLQGGTINPALFTPVEDGTYRVSAYWTNNGGSSCGIAPRFTWTDNSNSSQQDSIYYIPPFYNQQPYGQATLIMHIKANTPLSLTAGSACIANSGTLPALTLDVTVEQLSTDDSGGSQ